jgi:tetratricopeptide (TPR) repeat protein
MDSKALSQSLRAFLSPAALVCLLGVLGESSALAQAPNVAEANQRVEEGERLFEAGDFDGALAQFEQAYHVIGEHPNRYLVLYNIGQAHERRFRYDLAMEYYRRYLTEGGSSAPDRAEVESTVARLEGLLGTIEVSVNVPRAEVWMDDRQIGDAPGAVLVPGGRHVIEVRATGHGPERREVQIAPRTTISESFTLTRTDSALDPLYFTLATAATGVLGLAAGGFGIAVLLVRQDIDQRLADDALRYSVTDATVAELQAYGLATDILFGAALLFGATAIVLALLTDFGGSAPQEAQVRWAPFASRYAGGIALEGAW